MKQVPKSAETRRLRLEAMTAQVDAGFNFLRSAENALVLGRTELAREALERARHTSATIRRHVAEPDHVPPESIPGLYDQLRRLDEQISGIAERISG